MEMILVIASSLLLLDYSASIKIFNQCTDGKHNELNTEPAVINYTVNSRNMTCEWTIPKSVTVNGYAVILWLEKLQLRDEGTIKFPGSTYQFNGDEVAQRNICWMYTSNMSDCNMTDFDNPFPRKNVSCNNVIFWEDIGTQRAINFTSQKTTRASTQLYHNSSFIIHYYPIKCNATTTTTENLQSSTISSKDNFLTTGIASTLGHSFPALTGLIVGCGLLILSVVAVIVCYKKWKSPTKPPTPTQHNSTITSHLPTRSKKTYVNHVETTDEAGYEIPTNARQYENLQTDGQYVNLKDADDMYEDVETDTDYANTEFSVA